MRRRMARSIAVAGLITTVVVLGSAQVGRPATTIRAYAQGRNGSRTVPLLSVNDRVPLLSDPSRSYRMVGVPDGLGLRPSATGTLLYMNHELHSTDVSQPILHGPKFRGAFVSEWRLNEKGDLVGGAPAFRRTYEDTKLVGPIATTRNNSPAFGRFCSGTMAGRNVGFTQPIYLTNEEDEGGDTFDGRGGQTVAVYHHEAHALSKLGHFSKENSVVWPNDGAKTVVISLEDGPLRRTLSSTCTSGRRIRRRRTSSPRTAWTTVSSTCSRPRRRGRTTKPRSQAARSQGGGSGSRTPTR
jgi:hypothetical protein